MTAFRGIAVDAMNPFGRPSVRSLKLLKVNGVRIVAFPEAIWAAYYRELEAGRLTAAVAYTGQSFDGRGIVMNCHYYARTFNPLLNIIGNEFNVQHAATYPERIHGDDEYVALWNEAAWAIRSVRPDAKLYTSWYSDPDPINHIRAVHGRLDPKPDGVDYHSYDESYEGAERIFKAIRTEIGCEVACLEWNDSDPAGVARFEEILERSTDHSAWFCYHDLMEPGHGVMNAKGQRKPQWYALRDAHARARGN